MSKTLYVGDPHFKHSQKSEMESLMTFVEIVAADNDANQIVILGDLNDTFGVLRTDNLTFWQRWLVTLARYRPVYVLVGNHDKKNQSDDNDLENSLYIFNLIDSPNLHIIQSPVAMGIFGFVPYIHDKKRLVEESNKLRSQGAEVLICHSEFQGGAYDNGFFIKDGIDPKDLDYNVVISGHIHTRSTVGKVRYPGAPRWMTASDANKEKGIWLVTHDDETGDILEEEFFYTNKVCTPIYAYEYKEGEVEPMIPEGSRASVELIGSSEWIGKEKHKFKGIASISTKVTDKSKPANRKTGKSLKDFIDSTFEPTKGLDRERLVSFMKELGVL